MIRRSVRYSRNHYTFEINRMVNQRNENRTDEATDGSDIEINPTV